VLRAPLDDEAALFLGFLCVQLVCYPVALLRSDAAHLQNTVIALPFILVLGVQYLPRWLAAESPRRTMGRWAFVIVALAILPVGRFLKWREILVTPYTRFVPRRTPAPIDTRVSNARGTPFVQPFELDGTMVSERDWLDFADGVHTIVGDRKTYIATTPLAASGGLYFLADLTPAPFPLDRDTLILNERARLRVLTDIRAHPDRYQAFISTSLDAAEAKAFMDAHPGAERLERPLGGKTVYILLARAGV
jgi:hypothetical protein